MALWFTTLLSSYESRQHWDENEKKKNSAKKWLLRIHNNSFPKRGA